MSSLSGKVALVTGAASKRGMGRAVAVRLAKEGADVAVLDKYAAPRSICAVPPDASASSWRSTSNENRRPPPKPAASAKLAAASHAAQFTTASMLDISTAAFWIAVLQIILIDILLGGDNAVVIALACRKLPDDQRKKGIFWGVVGAIGLRVVLIFFALQLLSVPWLKIVGALLLFWIGIKLLLPEDEGHGDVAASTSLAGAIKTIIVADAVLTAIFYFVKA